MYYKIYHVSVKISDDALNEIKAGGVILALEGFLYAEILIWLEVWKIAPKRLINILWSTPFIIFIALVIGIINQYIFIYRNKWKKYNKEFSSYSQEKKFWLNTLIVIVILFVITSLILSIYELKQSVSSKI